MSADANAAAKASDGIPFDDFYDRPCPWCTATYCGGDRADLEEILASIQIG